MSSVSRYFRMLLVVVLFSTTAAFSSLVFSNRLSEIFIDGGIESEGNNIYTIFDNAIWSRYSSVFDNLYNLPKEEWNENEELERFKLVFAQVFKNIPSVTSISLYDREGKLVISATDIVDRKVDTKLASDFSLDKTVILKNSKTIVKPIYTKENPKTTSAIMAIKFKDNYADMGVKEIVRFIIIALISFVIMTIIYIYIYDLRSVRAIIKQYNESLELAEQYDSIQKYYSNQSKFMAYLINILNDKVRSIFSKVKSIRKILRDSTEDNKDLLSEFPAVSKLSNVATECSSNITRFCNVYSNNVEFESIDLKEIINSCVNNSLEYASKINIEIDYSADKDEVKVSSSEAELIGVTLNLLKSVIDHSIEGSTIFLSLRIMEKNAGLVIVFRGRESILTKISDKGFDNIDYTKMDHSDYVLSTNGYIARKFMQDSGGDFILSEDEDEGSKIVLIFERSS